MKQVQLTTDGSCLGNPGPGGWACILRCENAERELTGQESVTTNNRMELLAAISGLTALNQRCMVEIVTDSKYVRDGITRYIARWKANGWRAASGEPVKNQDLWVRLDELVAEQEVRWSWVKGHAGDPDQNRCDALALGAARSQKLQSEVSGCRS